MTSQVGALDPSFTALISSLMQIERQPLTRLETKKTEVNTQHMIYTDLNIMLEDLQDSVQGLLSTDPFYSLTNGRSTTISPEDSDTNVLTASAGASAAVGSYEISVSQRAQSQRQASAVQASNDLALGLSGTFWLGGTGSAGASFTSNAGISAISTTAVAEDEVELAASTYSIEMRDLDGTRQFRLVDVDGNAVSILDHEAGDGSTTTSWQDVTTGAYDTGRGMEISFGTGMVTSTDVDYTAAGTSIEVEANDTLLNIANMINEAGQPEGREIEATVVGTQLVLTAENTGTAHTMIFSDGVGLGFSGVDLQEAKNALFTVNDIAFSRSSNDGISDVIQNVSFSLAADAEGKTAALDVVSDTADAQATVDTFLENFNKTVAYIEAKSAIKKSTSGDTTTYTRGALADDTVFGDLRSRLLTMFFNEVESAGEFNSLRDIGLTINDNLQAEISDASALTAALAENLADVGTLMDGIMAEFDEILSRFTGSTTGYMDSALDMVQSQLTDLNYDIEDMNERLEDREDALTLEYAELQAQLINMSYTQQMWASIYSYNIRG
ncbi:MAG: flagellar filament capping protein FliD [Anaerolineales bacterium]|nr:flagellar filament capping protein FliD [Anaerolineales bacterium]